MAGAVIDASVATKWLLDEEGSTAARDLSRAGLDLIAPDLVLFEVFSSLSRAVRQARVPPAATEEVTRIVPALFDELVPTLELFGPAARLASSTGHAVYDCAYLVLARDRTLTLVTADETQFAMARQARIDARLL